MKWFKKIFLRLKVRLFGLESFKTWELNEMADEGIIKMTMRQMNKDDIEQLKKEMEEN